MQDELGVARDLFNALQSFYRMFPHFQQRPVIITGEVSRLLFSIQGMQHCLQQKRGTACSLQVFRVPRLEPS